MKTSFKNETSQNNSTFEESGEANDKTIESLNSTDKIEIDNSKTDDANEKNNKQFLVPKKKNEVTARIEEITANGIVKIKFSEEMKDQEDGFDISLINHKSM